MKERERRTWIDRCSFSLSGIAPRKEKEIHNASASSTEERGRGDRGYHPLLVTIRNNVFRNRGRGKERHDDDFFVAMQGKKFQRISLARRSPEKKPSAFWLTCVQRARKGVGGFGLYLSFTLRGLVRLRAHEKREEERYWTRAEGGERERHQHHLQPSWFDSVYASAEGKNEYGYFLSLLLEGAPSPLLLFDRSNFF